jgi:NAD(P)-dependent dehydrogenase (short-subunit alcohol dehydrogenase family)
MAGQKVAIITGGADGMGERSAHTLAANGFRVVIADRQAERGAMVTEEITATGGSARFIHADVTIESEVKAIIDDTMSSYGRVDAIDNNAAGLELLPDDGAIADVDPALFLESLRADLFGPFVCCKHVIPAMIASGGGSIINMASVSGLAGELSLSAYGIAKAGVIQLTRAVATQYGRQGIRCNAIAPSYVTTRTATLYASTELVGIYERVSPLPRVPEPQDIADLVAFLASEASQMITGQVIPVDAGLRAAAPIVAGYREWQRDVSAAK